MRFLVTLYTCVQVVYILSLIICKSHLMLNSLLWFIVLTYLEEHNPMGIILSSRNIISVSIGCNCCKWNFKVCIFISRCRHHGLYFISRYRHHGLYFSEYHARFLLHCVFSHWNLMSIESCCTVWNSQNIVYYNLCTLFIAIVEHIFYCQRLSVIPEICRSSLGSAWVSRDMGYI